MRSGRLGGFLAALLAGTTALASESRPAAEAEAADFAKLEGLGEVRYHKLHATSLDQMYHLFVRLPEGYAEAKERYPTVYLLDGGLTFPLLAAYYRYLDLGDEVPELILVGISYGTDDWKKGNNRSRDYTAKSAEREHWGGAPAFQAVLRDQILPAVEGRYRSDPARRIVFGQSLGGQLVLHAALTAPDLFWGYVASNPALHRNLDFFLKTPPAVPAGERRLFVASGEKDEPQYRGPARAWIDHWTRAKNRPWTLETATLPGQSHFSAPPAAFRAGISWLFSAP